MFRTLLTLSVLVPSTLLFAADPLSEIANRQPPRPAADKSPTPASIDRTADEVDSPDAPLRRLRPRAVQPAAEPAAPAKPAPQDPVPRAIPALKAQPTRATTLGAWKIGVNFGAVPDVLVGHLPKLLGKHRGVLLTFVTPDLPADSAGLRQYDVVLAIDGRSVATAEQARELIGGSQGRVMELTVVQAGESRAVTVQPIWEPKSLPAESYPGVTALAINAATPRGSVFLTGVNGRFRFHAEFADANGKRKELAQDGSLAEILPVLDRLPDELYQIVHQRLSRTSQLNAAPR